MPFLSHISLPKIAIDEYPFAIPAFKEGINLTLRNNVTFFVGENGSGKSTLMEAIAEQCGFSLRGGNRNHNLNAAQNFDGYETPLSSHLTLGWTPKRINQGFFMRAESFFNFADYIDEIAAEDARVLGAYGGKSLHQQSHGESFLSLFSNQFHSGIYILDEPEAALSPNRLMTFMSIINNLEKSGKAQFLIATHSPMLLCYPNASIYNFTENGPEETSYKDTEHYQLTKSFLDNPESYFRFLFE
ncbi:ATPase AAA [Pedobacter lusitanus]|uniref:Contig78, whole genome shotgun sequence n=1 Tax=Pedobacter lusitanus TaxID=1503925 RepID=A0A0D0GF33_9SPHI|nr:AAA family ATPase [Pedobacter lusitanus]KIO75892.1 ATPase AAA [Pedobacter lusitanus]